MGIDRLQEEYTDFKEKRDWERFHEPKNIAMSISIEASELMEHSSGKTIFLSRK